MMNPALFGLKWLIPHLFSAKSSALMLKGGAATRLKKPGRQASMKKTG